MSNVHFQLDHPNKERSTIILTYHYQGSRFRYSLGIQCETAKWDKKRELSRQQPGSNQINAKIYRMRAVFEGMIYHYEKTDKRHPSWPEMKEYLNVHFKGKIKDDKETNLTQEPPCMLKYIDQLITDWTSNGRIQPSSIKVYRRTFNMLKRIFKTPLSPEYFITDAPSEFVKYIRSQNKAESYVKKCLGNFTTFVEYALKDPNVPEIRSHSIKASQFGLKDYNSDAIYLTNEQVEMLENIDLSFNPELDIVRDLFLFAVYSGMRYSDVHRTKQWHFNVSATGIKYLMYTSKKTKNLVKVPLKPKAIILLDKYTNDLPTRSDQHLNRKLKEIARLAGLTDGVTMTKKLYNNEKTIPMQRFERISMHTARRSFCSLASRDGVPDRIIMACSGHKSLNAFKRYILQTTDDHIDDTSQYDFFTK
jgi:integrase